MRPPWLPLSVSIALFLSTSVALTSADELPLPAAVATVFKQHCWDCHQGSEPDSALRLDSMDAALQGGDSGERVIVPGDATASHLIERLTADSANERMPPDSEPLDAASITLLKDWINDKGKWSEAVQRLANQRLNHWSLQPLRDQSNDQSGDQIEDPTEASNRIDDFVQRRLHEQGLDSAEPADRRVLIRRLYLLMHGLPPTQQQTQSFLADRRPDAWPRLVERVLSSPRYGERWAAHWLDLVRFGETHGFETNRERPNAWHYRDWVIRSLNQDKPFDRFVMEQIAGDQLGEPVGTGFLVAGPYDIVKGQDELLRLTQRQDELAGIINTTGTAFLGLTIGCARCHNHKFDPISQTDYYAFQAVFAGVNHADRTLPLSADSQTRLNEIDRLIAQRRRQLQPFLSKSDDHASLRPAPQAKHNIELIPSTTVRFVRFTIDRCSGGEPCIDELEIFSKGKNVALASGGAKATSGGDFVHRLHKLEHINDGQYGNSRSWIAKQASGGWVQIELPSDIQVDRIEWGRDRDGKYQDRLAVAYRIEGAMNQAGPWRQLASSADRLPVGKPSPSEPSYDFSGISPELAEQGRAWLADVTAYQSERKLLERSTSVYAGTFSQPGPTHRLYRGEPTAPREAVTPNTISRLGDLRLEPDTVEADRRLQLARWIASPENPLTARVIVNRIWQFHFGKGLVATPSDFGANGASPTHPALLDWLASDLITHGWSLKHVHRRILNSATWRQSSEPRPDALARDADNRWLWRFAPRRLEAEGIRDCIVFASGSLNDQMGGPGFSAFEVELENVRHYFPKRAYGPADWRRMVYMTKVRQEKDSVFGPFDCPDASQVVPQRSRSTTPLQALSLLNSKFVLQQAELLGRRLTSAGAVGEQARLAYQICFQREADDEEVRAAVAFIEAEGILQFSRALFNSNEFVFIP